MRRVGWLLVKWGQLETKIGHGIYSLTAPAIRHAMNPDKISRTLEGKLGSWENAHQQVAGSNRPHMDAVKALRVKIKDASKMRNTLAHSISAMVVGPGHATVGCYPEYLPAMMLTDTYSMITYDLQQLNDALELVEPFIVEAMMLNQTARQILDGKQAN